MNEREMTRLEKYIYNNFLEVEEYKSDEPLLVLKIDHQSFRLYIGEPEVEPQLPEWFRKQLAVAIARLITQARGGRFDKI